MNITVGHVLLFALVVYALYYLLNRCGCKEGMKDAGVQVNCADRITKHSGADLVDEIDQCLFKDGDNNTLCSFEKNFWSQNKCKDFEESMNGPGFLHHPDKCWDIWYQTKEAWVDLSLKDRAKLCEKYTNILKANKGNEDKVCKYDLTNVTQDGVGTCTKFGIVKAT